MRARAPHAYPHRVVDARRLGDTVRSCVRPTLTPALRTRRQLEDACQRAWVDPIRRLDPFEEAVRSDQVHDQARAAQTLAGGAVPELPVDGCVSNATPCRALTAV